MDVHPLHCEYNGKLCGCLLWKDKPIIKLLNFIKYSDLIDYRHEEDRHTILQTRNGILSVKNGDFIVKVSDEHYEVFNEKRFKETFTITK